MRNLRICAKFSSQSPLPSHDSSLDCVADEGNVFQLIRNTANEDLPVNGTLRKYNLLTSETQELVVNEQLQDVCHMQYSHSTACLYMGTNRGQFLQYYENSGELEEVLQSAAGMTTFAVSPDCCFVVIISSTGSLILFSLTTFDVILKKELFEAKNADDDGTEMKSFSVCWRHDSHYFVVNAPDDTTGRKLAVYDEQGTLFASTQESISVPTDILAWMPSGALIATIEEAKIGTEAQIVLLELNMLTRSSFNPRVSSSTVPDTASTSYEIKNIRWNASSEIMAITKTSAVELWHRSNYLWMCKYTIQREVSSEIFDSIRTASWDHRNPYRLYVIYESGHYSIYDCTLAYNSGSMTPFALSVAINGCNLYCTPFTVTSAPPPYGFVQLSVESSVQEVVVSNFCNGFLCVLLNGTILQVDYDGTELNISKTFAIPKGEIASAAFNWSWPNPNTICCINEKRILVYKVAADSESDVPKVLTLKHTVPFSGSSTSVFREPKPSCKDSNILLLLTQNEVSLLNLETGKIQGHSTLPLEGRGISHYDIKYLWTPSFDHNNDNILDCLGLVVYEVYTGRLEVFLGNRVHKVTTDCSSTAIFHDYLLYTTIQGMLYVIHVSELEKALAPNSVLTQTEHYSRKVDKGSLIVSCCVNRMNDPTLVLQALPRGNIETIHPRPVLLASIKTMLRKGSDMSFTKILGAMRRHRIDANILVEELKLAAADTSANLSLTDAVRSMATEVRDPNLFVLFVTEICTENLEFVRQIRATLEERVFNSCIDKSAVQPYLAAMARLGLYEEILNSKLIFGETNREVVKSRVQFLSFYADKSEETLYNAALATYDLNLVAVVADCLGKDPKEYLPILNHLRTLTYLKRRFTINLTLKKWEKGFQDLLEDSTTTIDEIKTYVQKHQIYKAALNLLRPSASTSSERSLEEKNLVRKTIENSYAEFLESRGETGEASILYQRSGNLSKSVDCAVKAGAWEYALAYVENDRKLRFCRTLLHSFEEKQEWENAARLCEVYLSDYHAAIKYWINGHQWEHVLGLTLKETNSEELLEELIKPKLIEYQHTLVDHLTTVRIELGQHSSRFTQIKVAKERILEGGENLENGDSFSDTESVSTHSNVSSSKSGRSYRSGKSKRKQERKVHSLKKGSKYEDKAIIARVWELVTNVQLNTKGDIERTTECLCRLELDEGAFELCALFDDMLKEISAIITQIWSTNFSKDEDELLDPKYFTAPTWTSSWKKPSFLSH